MAADKGNVKIPATIAVQTIADVCSSPRRDEMKRHCRDWGIPAASGELTLDMQALDRRISSLAIDPTYPGGVPDAYKAAVRVAAAALAIAECLALAEQDERPKRPDDQIEQLPTKEGG